MTSTITYKGETIATASNETKTLTTAGKYLEGNISVTDATPTPALQTKARTYTPTNAQQTDAILPDTGYAGLAEVDVTVDAVPQGSQGSGLVSRTKNASQLMTIITFPNVQPGYFSSLSPVAAPQFLENKSATPTRSTQTINPTTTGHYLDSVTVDPIPPEYIIPSGTLSITANGTGIDCAQYAEVDVAVPSSAPTLQSKTRAFTPDETQQTETVTADAGFDGLSSVGITVNAIPSDYVGSDYSRLTANDLVISGASVSVPSGHYTDQPVTGSVAGGSVTAPATVSGTAATVSTGNNTLTLSKTVSITPTVTTPGYISTGTASNSTVSLQANVTTKAAATYSVSTTDQTIPAGTYLTGAQTFSAIRKQDKTVTANGTVTADTGYDALGTVTVNVSGGGGGKAAQISQTVGRATSSTYTAVGPSITVGKTGTYSVYWSGYRSSTSGTSGSQLYINNVAHGSAHTTFNTTSGLTNTQSVHETGVSLTQGQVLTIRARSRGNNYYMYILDLMIIEE